MTDERWRSEGSCKLADGQILYADVYGHIRIFGQILYADVYGYIRLYGQILYPDVYGPECDIRENFDTNECPNIFVSTKLHE